MTCRTLQVLRLNKPRPTTKMKTRQPSNLIYSPQRSSRMCAAVFLARQKPVQIVRHHTLYLVTRPYQTVSYLAPTLPLGVEKALRPTSGRTGYFLK